MTSFEMGTTSSHPLVFTIYDKSRREEVTRAEAKFVSIDIKNM